MSKSRITLLLDPRLLAEVDAFVRQGEFSTRSQCIQWAVTEEIRRMRKNRLAEQCALLDPAEEHALAEEGLSNVLAD
jgi:metal-responsive CopG/Arc/MetJ family transcriptional regulator